MFQVETGSLQPALHRMETKGWISAALALSNKGKRAKFFSLTRKGWNHLAPELSKWEQFPLAKARDRRGLAVPTGDGGRRTRDGGNVSATESSELVDAGGLLPARRTAGLDPMVALRA